jgi:hypothetical protein
MLLKSNNVELLRWPFWKWRPVEVFRCRESIQDVEIEQCWICVLLWRPFWKWWPVEICQCRESIRDIIIYPHIKFWWYRTMLHFCGIVVAILKMATGRNFSMSGITSGHHYLPTYHISMILYNDVPNWFSTLKNFYRSPFSKCPPQYRKHSTLSDIIKIWYVGR